jgi:2'-5' RNA ligase
MATDLDKTTEGLRTAFNPPVSTEWRDWQPGEHGRGLFHDNQLTLWSHDVAHWPMAQQQGLDPEANLHINPDGSFWVETRKFRPEPHEWQGGKGWSSDEAREQFGDREHRERERLGQQVEQLDPRLKHREGWYIGKVADYPIIDPMLRDQALDSPPSWQFQVHENPWLKCELCDYETRNAQVNGESCPNCGGNEWIPISAPTGPSPGSSAVETDSYDKSQHRVAKETLPQQLRRWNLINDTTPGNPSHPEVEQLHQWPDGYAINRLHSPHDAVKAGQFMRNCWKDSPTHNYWDRFHEGGYRYHTLTDEQGLPRVAFYTYDDPNNRQPPIVQEVLGMRNRQPKPDHANRIAAWADQNGYFKSPMFERVLQGTAPVDPMEEYAPRGTIGEPVKLSGFKWMDTQGREWGANTLTTGDVWQLGVDDHAEDEAEGEAHQPDQEPVAKSHGLLEGSSDDEKQEEHDGEDRFPRKSNEHASTVAWQQGEPGKALYMADGSVHAWPASLTPSHQEYMHMNGLSRFDAQGFYDVTPDGRVLGLNDDPHMAEVAQAIGGQKTEPNTWYLSAALPQVVEHSEADMRDLYREPLSTEGDPYGLQGYERRRPLIYHAPSNTIHIGPANYAHTDVMNAAQAKEMPIMAPGGAEGWIGENPEGDYEDLHDPLMDLEYGWYTHRQQPPPEVHQALDAHFRGLHGQYMRGLIQQPFDTWHLGAVPQFVYHDPANHGIENMTEFSKGFSQKPNNNYVNRQPIIYAPKTNTVHIGPANYAHGDVMEAARNEGHEIGYGSVHDPHEGWVGFNPEAADQGEYGWYGKPPRSEVDNAVRDHFNVQRVPDNTWSLSSVQHYITWEPGKHGRYLHDKVDGTIHAWPLGEPGSADDALGPDHYDYMTANNLPMNGVWNMGYINRKGEVRGSGADQVAAVINGHDSSGTWDLGMLSSRKVADYEDDEGYGIHDADRRRAFEQGLEVYQGTTPGQMDLPHQPVMLHQEKDQPPRVFVGQPGAVHQDLRDEFAHMFKPSVHTWSDSPAGWREYGVINPHTKELSWYGNFPGEDGRGYDSYPEAVAINRALGTKPGGNVPDACPKCDGTGADYDVSGGYYHDAQGACKECGGTGRQRSEATWNLSHSSGERPSAQPHDEQRKHEHGAVEVAVRMASLVDEQRSAVEGEEQRQDNGDVQREHGLEVNRAVASAATTAVGVEHSGDGLLNRQSPTMTEDAVTHSGVGHARHDSAWRLGAETCALCHQPFAPGEGKMQVHGSPAIFHESCVDHYGVEMAQDIAYGIKSDQGYADTSQYQPWEFHPEVDDSAHIDPTMWNFGPRHFGMNKTTRPMDEDFWQQNQAPLYHATVSSPDSIARNGLLPWDHPDNPVGTRYENYLTPRPGHVYLSQDPNHAYELAREQSAPNAPLPQVFEVDPTKLNPQNLNPDEDTLFQQPASGATYNEDYPKPSDYWKLDENRPWGSQAEIIGWGDDPDDTHWAWNNDRAVAHRGPIPPEAIRPWRVSKQGAAQIMYHVAPAHARQSIEQHGIDHGRKTWEWRTPEQDEDELHPHGNYLFADRAEAERYAQLDGSHLYAVDASGLPLINDHDTTSGHYTTEPIGPERLTRLSTHSRPTSQPTRQTHALIPEPRPVHLAPQNPRRPPTKTTSAHAELRQWLASISTEHDDPTAGEIDGTVERSLERSPQPFSGHAAVNPTWDLGSKAQSLRTAKDGSGLSGHVHSEGQQRERTGEQQHTGQRNQHSHGRAVYPQSRPSKKEFLGALSTEEGTQIAAEDLRSSSVKFGMEPPSVPPRAFGWRPGFQGKALSVNGQPYMWAVDDAGYPNHGQVVQALTGYRGYGDGNMLHIAPNGMVESTSGIHGVAQDFAALHPDLFAPRTWRERWRFGASEPRVELTPQVSNRGGNQNGWDMLYDTASNVLHIGETEKVHHHDIYARTGIDPSRTCEGFISKNGIYQWYDTMPDHRADAVHQAIVNHLGHEIERPKPNTWYLGASSEDSPLRPLTPPGLQPWLKGAEGKGLWLHGKPYIWQDSHPLYRDDPALYEDEAHHGDAAEKIDPGNGQDHAHDLVYINPHGAVEAFGENPLQTAKSFADTHPDLMTYDDWITQEMGKKFPQPEPGPVWNLHRAADQIPVEVHDAEHPWSERPSPNADVHSTAMIYDYGQNKLHVGAHDDVYHDDLWPHTKGYGAPGYISYYRNFYQWYEQPPAERKQALHDAIQQHMGRPVREHTDWDFEAHVSAWPGWTFGPLQPGPQVTNTQIDEAQQMAVSVQNAVKALQRQGLPVPPELAQAAQAADRVHTWKFQSNDLAPKVQWYDEVNGGPGHEADAVPVNDVEWQGDHSFLYEPGTDTIHIGTPDVHHSQLYSQVKGRAVPGWVFQKMTGPSSAPEFQLETDDNMNRQRVFNHLQQLHTEQGHEPFVDGKGTWHLGGQNYPTPPIPDHYFGGIAMRDGTFAMFDSEQFTHPQYMERNDIDSSEVAALLGWSPERREWIDYSKDVWHLGAEDKKDELHVGLEIPEHINEELMNWVEAQDWPEGTEIVHSPDYHITLMYAPEGYSEHKDADWIHHTDGHEVEVDSVEEFTNKDEPEKTPTVLKLKSDGAKEHAESLQAKAEAKGLEISKFPGGYKPHLTIAYGPGKPKNAEAPKMKFKTGPSSVSDPRIEKESAAAIPQTYVYDAVKPHPQYTDRRPVVYIPDRDELHIGGRGDDHGSIYQTLDPEYEDSDLETWNGYYNHPGKNTGWINKGPGFGWYDNADPTHDQRIVQALRENLPDYQEPEIIPQNTWDLTAKTAGMEWAGYGTWGKGFLDNENKLHTWNDWTSHPQAERPPIGEWSRDWAHDNYAANRGVAIRDESKFYIGPDGEVGSMLKNPEVYRAIKERDPRLWSRHLEEGTAPQWDLS